MKKVRWAVCAPLLAALTAVAAALLDADVQTADCTLFFLRDVLKAASANALLLGVVWALLCVFYLRLLPAQARWARGEKARAALLSVLAAAVLALSPAYRAGEGALKGFMQPYHLLLLGFKLCAWTPFFMLALKALVRLWQRPAARTAPVDARAANRAFALSVGLMLLCWLPGLLARFPAALNNDESRALQMCYGEAPWTSDHPYAYTLLLNGFMRLGMLCGSANAGAALFVGFQTLLLACALGCTVRELLLSGVPRAACAALACLYALCPLFAHFPAVILKDVLYSAVFVWYTLALRRALENRLTARWKAALLLCSLSLLLLRVNGRLIVYPVTLWLLVRACRGAQAREALRRAALLVSPVVLALVFGATVAAGAIHVDSTPDLLGVALQQTGRIVRDHPEDVTESERAAIDALVSYDGLAQGYNAVATDGVKRLYRYDRAPTTAQKADFVRAWLALAARHPQSALHATLALTGGYLDPLADGTSYIGQMMDADSNKYVQALGLSHPAWTNALRERWDSFCESYRQLPPVRLLSNVGTYAWALLALWLLALRRRGDAWLLLPALMTLLCCLLAPAFYGSTRYAFPMVYTVPYLCGVGWARRIPDASKEMVA